MLLGLGTLALLLIIICQFTAAKEAALVYLFPASLALFLLGGWQYLRNNYRLIRRDHHFFIHHTLTKGDRYYRFMEQFKASIVNETEAITLMANTSAALYEVFDTFSWVGFYLVKDADLLILGPFQGSMACSTIRYGKGVCGTAWKEKKTQLVPDVEKFPGHIACSSLSRSEIVLPLFDSKGEVKAVLDIDSTRKGNFDETDKVFLEKLTTLLSRHLYT